MRGLGFNGGVIGPINTSRSTLSNGIYTVTERATGYPINSDTYSGYVNFLFQPIDGQTVWVDLSSAHRTISTVGSPVRSSSSNRTGGASVVTSAGNYLSGAAGGFGFSGSFVVEMTLNATAAAFPDRPFLVGAMNGLAIRTTASALLIDKDGVGGLLTIPWTYSFGVYHEVAVVRTGADAWRAYLDGNLAGTGTGAFTFADGDARLGDGYTGSIVRCRVTVGTDRGYTGSTIQASSAAWPT